VKHLLAVDAIKAEARWGPIVGPGNLKGRKRL
jgi:hypothetical protein